ncbi:polyhydroxyalkanoate synthesis repressor PhaR [Stappia taiwanensis]|uniref:Polyhydroxyalkanoate synthesis repressor PhaR n=1 Tax=Stappia taiwanensis TaxID=992267 RepID=A0A838XLV9_9HYPH|nr:polyhydroxyalkanoate synthesis repressor PhaR [Stappia taiwanensis]MBA4611475.1 polyhydroxyalkanoate synthesis repressor PhaR [Stappia taiwanensis]GGF00022.1 polyhydroxyalkanoate synthesis repressor PhaR [Stappia taiwanensis]
MAKTNEPTIIKKYANRRLYNTGTSTYVTLEDLAVMVKDEEDFVVYDAKSGDDITRSVLTQIIFEQENKGQNLLPITFLRQLIRFYGDSMQTVVPSYLDYSMTSLTREQDRMREQMGNALGNSAFEVIEDQVKRNAEIFDRAMRMFLPFGAGQGAGQAPESGEAPPAPAGEAGAAKPASSDDLDALKKQLADMQKKIDSLADDKK